ncbi:MAG: hypothetical protein ABSG32_13855 [Terriglobia bacterium]|jgi:uncharacterized protein related to proFAR isomerase
MDTETSKTIEILRSCLVDCVTCLKVNQENLDILIRAVDSLLETKHIEAQNSMTALDLKALDTLSNPSLDEILEKLKAIPKAI